MYIYTSKLLIDEKYEVQYCYIEDSEENSPLNLCYNFIKEFINTFSENSNFFYPILCNSGLFEYKLEEKNNQKCYLKSFGFDMSSVNTIKKILEDIIPRILILVEDIEEEAITADFIGLIVLNIDNFNKNNILINKKCNDMEKNEKNGFILSKILFHELFGHKKSGIYKNNDITLSAECFKDMNNCVRFVSKNYNYQYVDINKIPIENIKNNSDGESGYFLEYFFGDVYKIPVIELLDKMQNKIDNLGNLLNAKIWHSDIKILIEYLKLKYYIINNELEKEEMEKNRCLHSEIDNMKKIIINSCKDSSINYEDKIKIFYENQIEADVLHSFDNCK